jgi:hypothetical protein
MSGDEMTGTKRKGTNRRVTVCAPSKPKDARLAAAAAAGGGGGGGS